MEINKDLLQTELQELAGNWPVKVKRDKHLDAKSNMRFTDKRIMVSLNPGKIRSQNTYDQHIATLKEALSF